MLALECLLGELFWLCRVDVAGIETKKVKAEQREAMTLTVLLWLLNSSQCVFVTGYRWAGIVKLFYFFQL